MVGEARRPPDRVRRGLLQARVKAAEHNVGQKTAVLERQHELRFRKFKSAWKFFEAQPPSYRQLVVWRIVSAKLPGTRERRLAELIKASQEQRRL